jgi:hypothetical protein
MAEHGPTSPAGKGSEPETASADWLFRDEDSRKPAPPGIDSGHSPLSDETFDLADNRVDLTGPGADAGAAAATPDRSTRAAREGSRIEPKAPVEEVWSRQAEWGPTLLILAAWLFALAIALNFLFGLELYGLSFIVLLVGGFVAAVLSYPILITLERPVRVTPEQAVRDYYGALSHHRPHFRRMWLLLSTSGRITSYYGSFDGFKAYWVDRLKQLKGSAAGTLTPLVFEVTDYRAEKSGGQSRIDAEFTVKVSIRGQRQAGPIHTFPVQTSLVRGPDKMWYLENGTLVEPARETEPARKKAAQ